MAEEILVEEDARGLGDEIGACSLTLGHGGGRSPVGSRPGTLAKKQANFRPYSGWAQITGPT